MVSHAPNALSFRTRVRSARRLQRASSAEESAPAALSFAGLPVQHWSELRFRNSLPRSVIGIAETGFGRSRFLTPTGALKRTRARFTGFRNDTLKIDELKDEPAAVGSCNG